MNVHLFVMWDSNIQAAYGKSFGPKGYLEFGVNPWNWTD